MKEVFKEIGMKRLDGDKVFYYKHDMKGNLEGIISSQMDDFNQVGNEKFIHEVTEKNKRSFRHIKD